MGDHSSLTPLSLCTRLLAQIHSFGIPAKTSLALLFILVKVATERGRTAAVLDPLTHLFGFQGAMSMGCRALMRMGGKVQDSKRRRTATEPLANRAAFR